jgi:hypothetical protein
VSYLKWVSSSGRADRESWHVLERVTNRGWELRCGKIITTEKAKASATLPVGERTCESCATGELRDRDNEVVDQPGAETETVYA